MIDFMGLFDAIVAKLAGDPLTEEEKKKKQAEWKAKQASNAMSNVITNRLSKYDQIIKDAEK